MALELLTNEYWAGRARREYRHILEGYIWILPWVFLQFDQKKSERRSTLDGWATGDHERARKEKTDFLNHLHVQTPRPSFKREWPLAFHLLSWIQQENNRIVIEKQRQAARDLQDEEDEEDEDDEDDEDDGDGGDDEGEEGDGEEDNEGEDDEDDDDNILG